MDWLRISYERGEAMLHIQTCNRHISDYEYERSHCEDEATKRLYTDYIGQIKEAKKSLEESIKIFDGYLEKCMRHEDAVKTIKEFWDKKDWSPRPFLDGYFTTDSEFDAKRMLRAVRSLAMKFSKVGWTNGYYVIIWWWENEYIEEMYNLMGWSLEGEEPEEDPSTEYYGES